MAKKRRSLILLYARHFCTRCDSRVFPYDKLERRTLAPGKNILLASLNAARQRKDPDDPSRIAWCWRCMRFVETYRETYNDLIGRYRARRGVGYRELSHARIIPLRKRRSA